MPDQYGIETAAEYVAGKALLDAAQERQWRARHIEYLNTLAHMIRDRGDYEMREPLDKTSGLVAWRPRFPP